MPDSDIEKAFVRHGFHVDSKTLGKLNIYRQLLEKWQKAINLVSDATLENSAERHFFDSAQILRCISDIKAPLVDLGSGAGFPGLVLAILGCEDVHLIESDIRKATFLREVSRETKTPVTIYGRRIEEEKISNIGFVTARALAPLTDLLGHMSALNEKATGIFFKGVSYQSEIDDAKKAWNFEVDIYPSMTDVSGKILKINNISKK